MSQYKSSKKDVSIKQIIWISAVIVIMLWAANFILLTLDVDHRGVFGDMFGTVNSLFSGLAFAGIIITIFLQSRELKLQREELTETREEFKTQNLTLRLQRFENTFFNMLSLHHDIVNNIDWMSERWISDELVRRYPIALGRSKGRMVQDVTKGRDVFELHYSELKKQLRDYVDQGYISDNYKVEYQKCRNDFDHYFRNLYRIIKLVDTTQFTDIPGSSKEFMEKYKYTSIVRSQLSTFELLWLFYNCLSENGIEYFKPLVERYTLFKNLRIEELANGRHTDLYDESAFRKTYNKNFEG